MTAGLPLESSHLNGLAACSRSVWFGRVKAAGCKRLNVAQSSGLGEREKNR